MVNSDYDGKGEILSSGIVYAGNWKTAKSLCVESNGFNYWEMTIHMAESR